MNARNLRFDAKLVVQFCVIKIPNEKIQQTCRHGQEIWEATDYYEQILSEMQSK